jgi:signal transduction histidine kinase
MRRGSVRLRLTVLFGALFLAAGAALLAITYGLVSHATNGIFVSTNAGFGGGAGSAAGGAPAALPATDPLQAQATRIAGTAKAAENDALLLYSGIALGIMAVVSTALGWFAAGRALRPLRRITAAAQRISATNLHERLAVGEPDDDLRELADTIDDLFGRLDASFGAQRQFVANASHELRTPLARSRTMLEVALRDPGADAESLRATCRRVLAAGEEQERLLEALLALARGQRGLDRRAPVDLAAVTRDVLAARGAEIAASGLAMAVTLEPALLAGDRALTERGVANLIDNALRHNVPEGTVRVTVAPVDGEAVLTVANTGPVIPPGEVHRLLVPFQRGAARPRRMRTTAASDHGLGLGLPIVQAIATAHGADLVITARPEGGLAAELAFPAAHPAWYARKAPAAAENVSVETDLAASAQRLPDVNRMRVDAIRRNRYHYVVSRLTIDPDSVAR